MEIKQVKINELKEAEYNPRQMTEKQYLDLKQSIEKYGLVDPIIVNKDNTIIGGHQRVKIVKELGFENVPCNCLDLTKEQEKELNLRLNKNNGEWDWDLLANFNIEDLKMVGFDEKELKIDINIPDDEQETSIQKDYCCIVVNCPNSKITEVKDAISNICDQYEITFDVS